MLGIYTIADTLFAWLMVGAVLSSWLSVVIFTAAAAVAFACNVRIMSFALRLET